MLHNLIEALSVLENIEQLNREEFINLVKSFDVKTSMSIDVVNAAVVVNNYFIAHKLFQSGIKLD